MGNYPEVVDNIIECAHF